MSTSAPAAVEPLPPLWPQPIPIIGGTGEKWSGKAQPLDAKILTPTGWICMGDIQPGSEIIDPKTGDSCCVTGVFPQGEKPVYKVTFWDGSSTECCNEHLWSVYPTAKQRYQDRAEVWPLEKIRQEIANGRAVHVPFTEPVRFIAGDSLTVDPYLLGVLIGDGSLSQSVALTTADRELLDDVATRLPELIRPYQTKPGGYTYILSTPFQGGNDRNKNVLLTQLRELGLHGKKSNAKFIPERYMVASIWDRLSMLHGLCDTDGSATPGACEYTTVSNRLAEQVKELVRSLGGRASSVLRTTKYRHNGEVRAGQPSHRIHIRLPQGMCPFKLSRKASIYNQASRTEPARRILSIEPVGMKECQCIAVDSPSHLYVTDEYIVTHNTKFGLNICPGYKTTLVYDFEQSSTSYEGEYARIGAPFVRIDMQKMMHDYKRGNEYPFRAGYKPIDLFLVWLGHLRSVPAGLFRVIMIDPVTDLERGLTDWVNANPTAFGHTAAQYSMMSGIMWGDVKDYEKMILADITARCDTFYFTAHVGAEFSGKSPIPGKKKAKGKETLYELASLYLWFERLPDKDGNRPNVPAARVEKGRLEIAELVDGEVVSYSVLPPRLPVATPKAIREYFRNPAGKSKLSDAERLKEEVLSADDRLKLETAKAEAEAVSAQARATQAQAQQPTVVILHAPTEENQGSPDAWEINFNTAIGKAKSRDELNELVPQIKVARSNNFITDAHFERLKVAWSRTYDSMTA